MYRKDVCVVTREFKFVRSFHVREHNICGNDGGKLGSRGGKGRASVYCTFKCHCSDAVNQQQQCQCSGSKEEVPIRKLLRYYDE